MEKQSIDTYKLTSLEEPSDEVLSQLMHEVAIEVRLSNEKATRSFFDRLRAEALAAKLKQTAAGA